jgi:hypothetical protein
MLFIIVSGAATGSRDFGARAREWERKALFPMLALAVASVVILVVEWQVEANDALEDAYLSRTQPSW